MLRYFDQQKATPVTGSFQPRLTGLPGVQGRARILTAKYLAGHRRAHPGSAILNLSVAKDPTAEVQTYSTVDIFSALNGVGVGHAFSSQLT